MGQGIDGDDLEALLEQLLYQDATKKVGAFENNDRIAHDETSKS